MFDLLSISYLKKLNAHIIKKPMNRPVHYKYNIIDRLSSKIIVVDLKKNLLIIKKVLYLLRELLDESVIFFFGFSDPYIYKVMQVLNLDDANICLVFPWIPGSLTNFKKTHTSYSFKFPLPLRNRVPSVLFVQSGDSKSLILREGIKVKLPTVSFEYLPDQKDVSSNYTLSLNFWDLKFFRLLLLIYKNQIMRLKVSNDFFIYSPIAY